MKVTKTSEGWEIVPQTSDEQNRLKWLIESLQSHPGQQPCEGGTSAAANGTGIKSNKMAAFMDAVGGVDGYLQLRNMDPEMLSKIQASFSVGN